MLLQGPGGYTALEPVRTVAFVEAHVCGLQLISGPVSQGMGCPVDPMWAITGGSGTGSQGSCGLCGQGEA